MPSKRRKRRARGVLTVLIMLGASLLLVLIARVLRGSAERRVPVPAAAPAANAEKPATDDIDDAARRDLDNVLRGEKPK